LLGALDPRYDIHVLTPEGPSSALFAAVGATVHPAPVSVFTHTWDVQYRGARRLVLAREAARLPGHLRALRRALATVTPALVHVNDVVALPGGWYAARRGIPVVWHLRTSLADAGRDRIGRAIAHRLDLWSAALVAIDADVLASYPLRRPATVVPNPIAAPRVGVNEREELGIPPQRFVVGYAGFLRRQKGWPELVQATRLLVGRGVDAHLLLAGGGIRSPAWFRSPRGRVLTRLGVVENEEAAFGEALRRFGLEARTTMLPFTDDVSRLYRSVDAVAFPNPGRGLGRPVLEAAAYGLPSVASGSPTGAGLLLPGETGLLVPPGDAVALADALELLARDSQFAARLGARGAELAREQFSPAAVARRMESVYEQVIRR
jgi:glycosyltransferase involved in cell wall biosynthesis